MTYKRSGAGRFPDPRFSKDPYGLIAVGGDFKPETLIEAYSKGIFPWPQQEYEYLWFSPLERGVLDFNELHIPKSLKKFSDKTNFEFTVNLAFKSVIENCQKIPRKGQKGTWITPNMMKAYIKLNQLGYAMSVECWKESNLVGGIYGVKVKNVFSAESMFGLESNVSKLCLLELINILRDDGFTWLDIQMVTPTLSALGGKYISRDEFLLRINEAHMSLNSKSVK